MLRCREVDSLSKLKLAMYFNFAFNGEDLSKVGNARDMLVEFALQWLAREGVGVTLPPVRDTAGLDAAAVRTSVL